MQGMDDLGGEFSQALLLRKVQTDRPRGMGF